MMSVLLAEEDLERFVHRESLIWKRSWIISLA
jgi:hypothetical protein